MQFLLFIFSGKRLCVFIIAETGDKLNQALTEAQIYPLKQKILFTEVPNESFMAIES